MQTKKRASAGEQRQGQVKKIDDFEYSYNTPFTNLCQAKSFKNQTVRQKNIKGRGA